MTYRIEKAQMLDGYHYYINNHWCGWCASRQACMEKIFEILNEK